MKTLFFIFIFLSSLLHATIINIPANQPTIQDGINAAMDADTVLVQPGTYFENINYNGTNITVASLFLTTQDTTYISQTVIDGSQPTNPDSASVVIFCNGEDSTAVLTGFTITNGTGTFFYNQGHSGGGIYCKYNSSPSLKYITITRNTFDYRGGGIYCGSNSSPSLDNVTIENNTGSASTGGGGICCDYNSSPSLKNVTISGNTSAGGGGIWCMYNSSPYLLNVAISGNLAEIGGGIGCLFNSNLSIKNVMITGNIVSAFDAKGGGIFCQDSSPSLVNVTIAGNSVAATDHGGGIYCSANTSPSLINCILWNNSPQELYFCEEGDPNSITVSYSDIEGGEAGIETNNNGTVYWLEGNLDEDPLFMGTGVHPFMLQDLSPCVNTGDPDTTGLNLPEFDLAGNPRVYGGRIDMGAYENQNVVGANEDLIHLVTKLNQNYPNPFNPTTTINYTLKENSMVSLNIYNIKGQKVKQLVSDQVLAGQHSVIWNGKDDNGKLVSSGIYFYKLKTKNYEKTKRMVLIK